MSEAKKLIGVYQIKCNINNKIYIGSSDDIYRRWRDHKSKLNCNKHHSKYLQNAWNLHGSENFEFSILELLDSTDDLLILEQKYIDKFNCANNDVGYNIAKNAFAIFKGRNHSDQTKQLQSEKNSGENHWAYGKHLSEEHKKLISQVKRKIPLSKENEIIIDYNNHISVKCIAQKYDVHAETIYRILRKHGYHTKRGFCGR